MLQIAYASGPSSHSCCAGHDVLQAAAADAPFLAHFPALRLRKPKTISSTTAGYPTELIELSHRLNP
jgi:hypothetical protein